MLKQGGKWQLAPAYDVCHAFVIKHQWLNDHVLTINGKREGFVKADLMKIAASMNIKKAEGIIENIVSVVSSWQSYAEEARVPIKLQDQITINLNENLKPWQ
jgi:serine/threonine-protein kinase HipA